MTDGGDSDGRAHWKDLLMALSAGAALLAKAMADAGDTREPGRSGWKGLLVPLSAGASLLTALGVFGLPNERVWPWADTWHFRIAATVGAIAGAALVRRHFGLPGPGGLARAGLAFAVALFAGGMIGGTLEVPGWGTYAGPLIPVAVIADGAPGPIVTFILAPFAALRVTARWAEGGGIARDAASYTPPRPHLIWLAAVLAYAALIVMTQL